MKINLIKVTENESMNIKNRAYLLIITVCLCVFTSNSFAISKCQDEKGKWHYGTSVSSKCVKSEITKLNDRGVLKKRVAAPKTSEELKAVREKVEEEEEIRLREREESNQKNRILSIYEIEEDIERARNNNLKSINQQTVLNNAYIDSLRKKLESKSKKINTVTSQPLKDRIKQEMADIDVEIKQSSQLSLELEEKIKITNTRYDEELEVFRKYK